MIKFSVACNAVYKSSLSFVENRKYYQVSFTVMCRAVYTSSLCIYDRLQDIRKNMESGLQNSSAAEQMAKEMLKTSELLWKCLEVAQVGLKKEDAACEEMILEYVRDHLQEAPVNDIEWLSDLEPDTAVTEDDILTVIIDGKALSQKDDCPRFVLKYIRDHLNEVIVNDIEWISDLDEDSAVTLADITSAVVNGVVII